ncbi:helix-turn-helix domain-containing protein [Mucilaginibacter ginsenosidivorax]|uniref:Helix-turn-helix domain-containing protein n=1 Tax=Mucilaginibacter ginsenosidivorax TaxID=862126 RepID=A0A5B8W3W0_9SPHI|nr:helix-turn-helix domain-containing protein [Mucilaginibacter ginsenosidivorax]QEC78514.1 helix-turn-helix domain-containing protein [Mucilaginibacter ginsenosidivorax]
MNKITFEELPEMVGRLFAKLEKIEALLKQHKADDQDEDEMLTVDQAATFLNLAVPTIYSKVSRREIPVSKPGKRLYFSKSELNEYKKSGHHQTISRMLDDYQAIPKVLKRRSKRFSGGYGR